jgi:hypothetical protein
MNGTCKPLIAVFMRQRSKMPWRGKSGGQLRLAVAPKPQIRQIDAVAGVKRAKEIETRPAKS